MARWGDGCTTGLPGRDSRYRRGACRRPALGDDRLERSGEPNELRDLGFPEAVRVHKGKGRAVDDGCAPEGPRDRVLRGPGADGVRRFAAALIRPLGDGGSTMT